MGQSDAAFRHHLDEVTEAQFKCDVPSHTQNDDLLVKVPSLEQILCRGRFRHPGSYRRIPSLSTVCTRTSNVVMRCGYWNAWGYFRWRSPITSDFTPNPEGPELPPGLPGGIPGFPGVPSPITGSLFTSLI